MIKFQPFQVSEDGQTHYRSLEIFALILQVMGIIEIVIGGLMSLFSLATGAVIASGPGAIVGTFVGIWILLGSLIGGGLLWVAGEGVMAFRELVLNSRRIARPTGSRSRLRSSVASREETQSMFRQSSPRKFRVTGRDMNGDAFMVVVAGESTDEARNYLESDGVVIYSVRPANELLHLVDGRMIRDQDRVAALGTNQVI